MSPNVKFPNVESPTKTFVNKFVKSSTGENNVCKQRSNGVC